MVITSPGNSRSLYRGKQQTNVSTYVLAIVVLMVGKPLMPVRGMRGSLRAFHYLRPTYLSRRLGFRRLNCPNPWRRFADTTSPQAHASHSAAPTCAPAAGGTRDTTPRAGPPGCAYSHYGCVALGWHTADRGHWSESTARAG